MRLLHTSDWHLGHILAGEIREFEHETALEWLLDQIEQLAPDLLLITGDVYDVTNPPVPAQDRFYRFLRRARERQPNLLIVAIGGNHDSALRLELPRPLLDDEYVRIVGGLPRSGQEIDFPQVVIPVRDVAGAVVAVCLAIPFLRAGDLMGRTLVDIYGTAAAIARDTHPGVPMIVTGHLHCAGGVVSELSERRIIVGGQEAVATDIFPNDAAYVALGHLHQPQQIKGGCLVRYAGSLFPLATTERTYHHSVVLADITASTVEHRLLPIPRPVPFLRVPGTGAAGDIEAVLAALRVLPPPPSAEFRPFLSVEVEVDGPEPDLRRKVEEAIPVGAARLIKVERKTVKTEAGEPLPTLSEDLSEIDPEHIFKRLHNDRYGTDPSEELIKGFQMLLVQAQHEFEGAQP
jgi:DNA repair protein SbcD/Mre11